MADQGPIVLVDPDNEQIKLADNVELHFGSGADAQDESLYDIAMRWDGTNFDVLQGTADSAILWGIDGAGIDQTWYGDTASAYMKWDQSADQLLLAGAAKMSFVDDAKLYFGTSDDVSIEWDTASTPDALVIASAASGSRVWVDKNTLLYWGTQANTAGSAFPLSATDTAVARFYGDDGGASISSATFARVGVFRHLLTYAAGNREQEAAGVVGQLVSVAGTNRHNMAGVWGSYEAQTSLTVDGQAWSTDPWVQAAVLGRVGAGSGITTINANGVLSALAAASNTTSFAANNGYYTGLFVTKWAGTTSFTHGILMDPDAVVRGIYVGTLGSNITSGVPILNATSINGFFSDDNGADQTTSTVYRNVTARTYFSVSQTAAAADYHVLRGHLKAASGVNLGGDTSVKSAVNGYVELAGATTVGSGAFLAPVFGEIWADGNITATGKVAGVMSRIYTSGASTVGNFAAAFMATKQWASTDSWPCAIYIDAADYVFYWPTGTNYEGGVKITGITNVSTSASGAMKVRVGGTDYYIPLWAAAQLDGE